MKMRRKKHWVILGMAAVILFITAVPKSRGAEGEIFALKASKVYTGDGQVFEDGYVLVRGGLILAVGQNIPMPRNCPIEEFPGGVICPGLIDVYTALGAEGDDSEPVTALQPEARAMDVFDPLHQDFQEALADGITTVLIAPSPENVISGCAVAVKTAGEEGKRVLKNPGPILMTLAETCYKRTRKPTSRMGALDLLRGTLKDQRSRKIGPMPAFFVADAGYDVLTGLALAKEFDLEIAILGGAGADLVLDDMKGKGIPIVFGPFDFSTPERVLRLPSAAASAGVPVAFTARSPARSPTHLRITAALAVRGGLSRREALIGLTSRAAVLAGLADRVGRLASGMDADIAVFSDHPVNLNARLQRVYVNGRKAFGR